jgi:hypothetical protein
MKYRGGETMVDKIGGAYRMNWRSKKFSLKNKVTRKI